MNNLTLDESFWVTEIGRELSLLLGNAWKELQKDLEDPPAGLQWIPKVREIIEDDDGGATVCLGAELNPLKAEAESATEGIGGC